MSELLKRLISIARSYIPKKNREFRYDPAGGFETGSSEDTDTDGGSGFTSGSRADTSYPDYPQQVIEDLANFNLAPPSSLDEVRKARNREIKKYHPDRHMGDPVKRKTAKEILQIYNASYERLEAFYEKKQGI